MREGLNERRIEPQTGNLRFKFLFAINFAKAVKLAVDYYWKRGEIHLKTSFS